MTTEDAEEFTQALGQVVAGSYRQIVLAKNLGVPKALGLTVERMGPTRIGGYVRLSVNERKEAAKELTAEGMSQREVAEVLGIGTMTVNRDLQDVPNGTEKPCSSADSVPNVQKRLIPRVDLSQIGQPSCYLFPNQSEI